MAPGGHIDVFHATLFVKTSTVSVYCEINYLRFFQRGNALFFSFFSSNYVAPLRWWAVQLTYTTDKARSGASCEISERRPKACSRLMVARQIIGANGCGALQNGPSLLASSASHSVT